MIGGEGASNAGDPGGMGAPAVVNDATWVHTFYNTGFWIAPGGRLFIHDQRDKAGFGEWSVHMERERVDRSRAGVGF